MASNGRKHTRQEIAQLRANNPDTESTIAERIDNHVGHGKAIRVLIAFHPTCIIDASNGKWMGGKERLKSLFQQTGDSEEHGSKHLYTDDCMGKWHAGQHESCIKEGNGATTIANIDGELWATDLEVSAVMSTNAYKANLRETTTGEQEAFLHYQRQIDTNYQLSSGTGVMTKITELLKRPNKSRFEKTLAFVENLYDQTRQVKMLLYDLTNRPASCYQDVNQLANPVAINNGDASPPVECLLHDYELFAVENDDCEVEFVREDEGNGRLYTLNVQTYYFPKRQEDSCRPHRKGSKDDKGFELYRNGRRISPSTRLDYFPSTGGDRNRGLVVRMSVSGSQDQINAFDEGLKVGTNKKVDDGSWQDFDDNLKVKLEEIWEKAKKARKAIKNEKEKEILRRIKVIKEKVVGRASLDTLRMEKRELAEVESDAKDNAVIGSSTNKHLKIIKTIRESIDNKISDIERSENNGTGSVPTSPSIASRTSGQESPSEYVEQTTPSAIARPPEQTAVSDKNAGEERYAPTFEQWRNSQVIPADTLLHYCRKVLEETS